MVLETKNMIPVVLAFTGYVFNVLHQRAVQQRTLRIERVNSQLSNLYGPLLACVTASKASYKAMVKQHSPDGTSQGFIAEARDNPEGPAARSYRNWMRAVLQPLNERASELIMTHADLLDSPDLWTLMLQLVAHTSALKVILDQWEQGDLSSFSVITYPDALAEAASREYRRAKSLQAQLLGLNRPQRLLSGQGAGAGGGAPAGDAASPTPGALVANPSGGKTVATGTRPAEVVLNNRRPTGSALTLDQPRARL